MVHTNDNIVKIQLRVVNDRYKCCHNSYMIMVNNIVDEVLMNGLLVVFLMEEMVRGFQHGDVLIKVDVLSSNRVKIG